ncbi:MAG: hypothetical protein M3Y49_09990 [Actinomycetota bacterium]|nr:hypothetical protein [Actinomycetota bacterium]
MHESVSEEWVPVNPGRDWVLRTRGTGGRRWLRGSYRNAAADGFGDAFVDEPPREFRARHGDYYALQQGRQPDPGHGWPVRWQVPTPDFLAALRRDPDLLLQRLRADSPSHPVPRPRRLPRYPVYNGAWKYALDALRCALVPADVRAALYRALQLLPDVRVVDTATNLDGAAAIALVLEVSPVRHELLVDPGNGRYLGARETVRAWNPDFRVRPGTIIRDTAVRTTVVDDIDAAPPPRL